MAKSKKKSKPKVNSELEGFEIEVDSFGELKSSFEIDKLNEFLNKNLEDKKIQNTRKKSKKSRTKN